MFLLLDLQRDSCSVWTIGVSGMLVGTVMTSGESLHIYVKIWASKNDFEVQLKMFFMM